MGALADDEEEEEKTFEFEEEEAPALPPFTDVDAPLVPFPRFAPDAYEVEEEEEEVPFFDGKRGQL